MCKKGHPDSLPSLPVIFFFFFHFVTKIQLPDIENNVSLLGLVPFSKRRKKKRISCLPVILTTCPSSLFRIYMPSHHHGVEPNGIGFPERERERASSLANS